MKGYIVTLLIHFNATTQCIETATIKERERALTTTNIFWDDDVWNDIRVTSSFMVTLGSSWQFCEQI